MLASPRVAVVGVLLAVVSASSACTSDAGSEAKPTASQATLSSSTSSSMGTVAGRTVEGFPQVEDFPMEFVVPAGLLNASEGAGTRGYALNGIAGGIGAFLVESLAGAPEAAVPANLAAFLRERRDDFVVSNLGTTEVGGLPAQTFTLTQQPGTAPKDLWCAKGANCFKLLDDKPMDFTAVRTKQGLVLFTVEYTPEERSKAREPMDELLASVRWS